MMRNRIIACLGGILCTATALAQISPHTNHPDPDPTSSSPVAWVYVISSTAQGDTQLVGYNAPSEGELTPIPGSPFADDAPSDVNQVWIAVNGKYLFAVNSVGTDVDAYSIESDGALTYASSSDVVENTGGCNTPGPLFFDHTGAALYVMEYPNPSCPNAIAFIRSFAVNKHTGELTFLNDSGNNEFFPFQPLTFTGNNKFAYGIDGTNTFLGYRRNSSGSLTPLDIKPKMPTKAPSGIHFGLYEPVAADPDGHVAFAVQAENSHSDNEGEAQLATYTADSSGDLTTASTYDNMPRTSVGPVYTMNMSPSGKYLAVGGLNGVQVFHFNGSKPITLYGELLHDVEADQMFWDNANHLYVINQEFSQLWVFTVTSDSFGGDPGSPYSVHFPVGLMVQSLPAS